MRRILIVDDEAAVLNALRRLLRLAFFNEAVTIETFDDPEAAVLRAGEQDFDVVISDFLMPGLNGADVLQLVKGLQPDAARIVLSATTKSCHILAAVNRGEVFRYLPKPWQADDLIATVRLAFNHRDGLARTQHWPAADPAIISSTDRDNALYKLEQEEPGITYVDRDEYGNVRLF